MHIESGIAGVPEVHIRTGVSLQGYISIIHIGHPTSSGIPSWEIGYLLWNRLHQVSSPNLHGAKRQNARFSAGPASLDSVLQAADGMVSSRNIRCLAIDANGNNYV